MVVMLSWIYHVDGPIATLKPVLDEWKQHTVLFVFAIEKRTNVTYVAQLGTGKGNWCHGLLHGVYLALFSPDYGSPARRDDAPLVLQAAAAQPSSIACTSPNPTSIRLWYWPGGIHVPILPLLAISDAPSKETSTDTFVQLVSRQFSGLIAIVRSQEARLFGFRNRSDE